MIAAIFIFILLYLLYCRPYCRNLFQSGEYIGRDRTAMLNGILIMFVFVSHSIGYIPGGVSSFNEVDAYLCHVRSRIGQLMVAGFFFYSGFGIMESISRKGKEYLDAFPFQRFFRVLLHFDIAVLIYWLIAELTGRSKTGSEVLAALTGWQGIGNSNWFICVTLLLYIVTYYCFRWGGRWRWVTLWASCLLLILILFIGKNGQMHWIDTLLCFPAGMSLSAGRRRFEGWLSKTRIPAPLMGLGCIILAFVLHHPVRYNIFTGNLAAILFAYGSALLFAGIDFRKSPQLLLWMGGALFSLYIFQRIPMNTLKWFTDLPKTPSLFILHSLVLTIILTVIAERFYKWLDKVMFARKK